MLSRAHDEPLDTATIRASRRRDSNDVRGGPGSPNGGGVAGSAGSTPSSSALPAAFSPVSVLTTSFSATAYSSNQHYQQQQNQWMLDEAAARAAGAQSTTVALNDVFVGHTPRDEPEFMSFSSAVQPIPARRASTRSFELSSPNAPTRSNGTFGKPSVALGQSPATTTANNPSSPGAVGAKVDHRQRRVSSNSLLTRTLAEANVVYPHQQYSDNEEFDASRFIRDDSLDDDHDMGYVAAPTNVSAKSDARPWLQQRQSDGRSAAMEQYALSASMAESTAQMTLRHPTWSSHDPALFDYGSPGSALTSEPSSIRSAPGFPSGTFSGLASSHANDYVSSSLDHSATIRGMDVVGLSAYVAALQQHHGIDPGLLHRLGAMSGSRSQAVSDPTTPDGVSRPGGGHSTHFRSISGADAQAQQGRSTIGRAARSRRNTTNSASTGPSASVVLSSTVAAASGRPAGRAQTMSFTSPLAMQHSLSHQGFSTASGNASTSLAEDAEAQARLMFDKRRRRRESHNLVERRRRDLINDKIQELGRLVEPFYSAVGEGGTPRAHQTGGSTSASNMGSDDGTGGGGPASPNGSSGLLPRPNKGEILCRSVEYIQTMQSVVQDQSSRIEELQEQIRRMQLESSSVGWS